jgi:hypothetical protein
MKTVLGCSWDAFLPDPLRVLVCSFNCTPCSGGSSGHSTKLFFVRVDHSARRFCALDALT